jgi:hypothetical protein
MQSFTVRTFKNRFAEELFSLSQDQSSGFHSTHIRFEIYLGDLTRQIEAVNRSTLEQLKNESQGIAWSVLQQPDIDAQLNYFSNILQSGLIISIYTYFESQLSVIHEVCKRSEGWSVEFTPNNAQCLGASTVITTIKRITNWALNEDCTEESPLKLLGEVEHWVNLRIDLTHRNGTAANLPKPFLKKNSITITNQSIILSNISVQNFNNLVYDVLTEIVNKLDKKHGLFIVNQTV